MAAEMLSKDLKVKLECAGYAEVDPLARNLYRTCYSTSENELEIANIVTYRESQMARTPMPLRIGQKEIKLDIGSFDLLLADVPCERYEEPILIGTSMLGEIIWMASWFQPQFVLIEAPWNITTFDKSRSICTIINSLQNCGYFCSYVMLNSKDYGLPQDRSKVYIFGTREHEPQTFQLTPNNIRREFVRMEQKSCSTYQNIHSILEKNVKDRSMWLSDSSKAFIFATEAAAGKRLYPQLNCDPSMTIKPNMAKLQRANADNYYTEQFINSNGTIDESETVDITGWPSINKIRRITHRECMLLQGFTEEFFETVDRDLYLPDTALYKMIGQATNVNLAYAILNYIVRKFNLK